MTIAAAALSAYGSYEQGQAGRAAGMYQAQVALNNKTIADQNAALEQEKGSVLATNASLNTMEGLGQARASQGASGIDVNAAGTATRVQSNIVAAGTTNAMTIRANAARAAYGWQVQGMSQQAQANLDISGARASGIAGDIGAFSSLATGYSKYKMSGMNGTSGNSIDAPG
jgi:hypothetical protein